MAKTTTARRDRSTGELAREALLFALHTLAAIAILAVVLGLMTLAHPDPASAAPKIFATALAFLVPMAGGFVVARIRPVGVGSGAARYTWIAGLLLFGAVSVWVLDLPTGNGLCEGCGAAEKLWRTFFSIRYGSGLMGGDGLLVGCWTPLSMIGYAVGAALGLVD
jgi:hypothetical protein